VTHSRDGVGAVFPATVGPSRVLAGLGWQRLHPVDAADAVRKSRWLFVLLCCFIGSQVYTVPILPLGPWPLWPGLPDVLFGALGIAWLFMPRSYAAPTGVRRTVFHFLFALTVVCAVSYVMGTVLIPNLNSLSFGANQQGISFGLLGIARLIQFVVLYRIAISVPYTPFRLRVLRRVVTGAFLLVAVSVLITFHNAVPTSALAPLLPDDEETAGAWWYYLHNFDGYGLGAISYTHAYVAAQLTLLLGLASHLRGPHAGVGNSLLISLALVASLLSGSRAGFAGVLLVAGVFFLTISPAWKIVCTLTLALLAVGGGGVFSSQPPIAGGDGPFASIVHHQFDVFHLYQADNLVGREAIWSGRLDNLNDHSWRWFTGWGFGSSPDTGPGLTPHMLPLQVIMELGVGMLAVIALFCAMVLRQIWFRERLDHPFFWTTIALLASSVTQETFYPMPSTGYFSGFYLVALAIVLRAPPDASASHPAPGTSASRPVATSSPPDGHECPPGKITSESGTQPVGATARHPPS